MWNGLTPVNKVSRIFVDLTDEHQWRSWCIRPTPLLTSFGQHIWLKIRQTPGIVNTVLCTVNFGHVQPTWGRGRKQCWRTRDWGWNSFAWQPSWQWWRCWLILPVTCIMIRLVDNAFLHHIVSLYYSLHYPLWCPFDWPGTADASGIILCPYISQTHLLPISWYSTEWQSLTQMLAKGRIYILVR